MSATFCADQFIDQASRLYSLPAVALEVLRLTGDPGVDTATLKAALENDPALTSKVLRAINSPVFGLPQPVSNLGDAVTLLGIKPLKLLVLGFCLPPQATGKVESDFLAGYWRRALTKAVAARELATLRSPALVEDSFMAALLADVGMLALAQSLGRAYAEVVTRVREAGRNLPVVERHTLGFDHLQLTAHVLKRWGLPPAMVAEVATAADGTVPAEAVRQSDDSPSLAIILRLSELITAILVEEQVHLLSVLLSEADDAGLFTALELTSLLGSLETKVNQLAEVLGVAGTTAFNFEQMLGEAQARLAEITPDAAAALAVAEARARADVEHVGQWQQTQVLAELAERAARGAPVAKPAIPATAVAEPEVEREAPRVAHALINPTAAEPLLDRLAAAVQLCRKTRSPLGLLLVRADCPRDMPSPITRQNFAAVDEHCRQLDYSHKLHLRFDERSHGILLVNCDRVQLVHLAQEILWQVRSLNPAGQPVVFSASIGAAAAPVLSANFSAQRLFDGACRCLYAAAKSGSTVKSIEIY